MPTSPTFPVRQVLLLTATVFMVGQAAQVFFFRRRLARYTSRQQICERLGATQKQLEQIAEERGIQPRINLNGENYYDWNDFGDAVTLLRASSQPTATPETLLRPAEYNATLPAEQLLRASEAGE